MDTSFKSSVKLRNGMKLLVQGKGNIRLRVKDTPLLVQEVFYVPGLTNNLLSIGQMQEKGLAFLVRNGMCKIFSDEKGFLFSTTMQSNRMFVLLASVNTAAINYEN
ncbi:uncharacterized protein LOC125369595 [Ricinus communis]|uniref:uncharacterized protein LOC125369595 n=1 Tax=Ricinus communis TaxID=3988 RepID=UPI00201B0781|nr:uncharacterized protein LOC125369595 [Ricinus communis]